MERLNEEDYKRMLSWYIGGALWPWVKAKIMVLTMFRSKTQG